MQIEYQAFDATRTFGVELEVEQTLSKKQLAAILEAHEFIRNPNSQKEVQIEGKDNSKKWAESNGNSFWHVKYDSSCGPLGYKLDEGGWEIASYVGSGNDDIEHIASAGEFLGRYDVTVNKNCGLHVHIGVGDFSVEEVGVLLAYWVKIESFIFQANPLHRRNNKYCKAIRHILEKYQKNVVSKGKEFDVVIEVDCPAETLDDLNQQAKKDLADALKKLLKKISKPSKSAPAPPKRLNLKLPKHVWEVLKPTHLHTHENDDKKVSLNTVGFARSIVEGNSTRVTVELRVPECSLRRDHIENWVRLIVHFVEICKGREMPADLDEANSVQEVLSILGLHKEDAVLILSQDLYETKLWFLQKLVEYTEVEKIAVDAKQHIELITLI